MRPALLSILLAAACAPADVEDPTDTTDTTDTTTPEEDENVWYIDDEEHPALYPSLNCEMSGDRLILNGSDDASVGTLQMMLDAVPTADVTLTVTNMPPEAGQAYVSIGRDRESDNQYVASSGELRVTVIDAPDRKILVDFDDLPSATNAGATALLSGSVVAKDGQFVGACRFDEL